MRNSSHRSIPGLGWLTVLLAGALFLTGVPAAGAVEQPEFHNGSVYVDVTETEITIGNSLVERTWSRTGFGTTEYTRKNVFTSAGDPTADFTLDFGAAPLASTTLDVQSFTVDEIDRGLRLNFVLAEPGTALLNALNVNRSIEVYNGIAGFRTETSILSSSPLPLRGYTIDELSAPGAAPTIHAFRAGADWREYGWEGPFVPDVTEEFPDEFPPEQVREALKDCAGVGCPSSSVGDPHAGTWRDTRTAGAGTALSAPGEWISMKHTTGSTAFMMMERNDFPSSRARYDGSRAALVVDHTRDIVSAGPFEEQIHAENPHEAQAGRVRTIKALEPFELEAAFTGFALDEADEAWQFHKYLTREVLETQSHDITFNSNGTDDNVISTGAKDDMSYEMIKLVAPKAKAMGIETFILDDGWQAKSGEWFPDCPDHREPRAEEDPVKYAPRFTDCDFTAVREEIAPMKLGLWMNPMHYHPSASTWREHPDWMCQPVGSALHTYNTAEPTSSSNEAGLAQWGPNAIPYIESKIDTMVTEWEVEYFKFDFLVWLDCVGQGDLYEFKEAFGDMLDRLIAKYPHVTFTVDETNDYRLFPFESITRGASWFQNGSPEPDQLLHNIWNLSPWIPGSYLGQHFLGGGQWQRYPVDTLMAAALTSHMTFFSDLRPLPDWVVAEAAPWIEFYKANRDAFTQLIYPLLGDPIEKQWTALQSWNPEEGFGALLAFRQQSDSPTQTIALENVPEGMTFDLFAAPTGEFVRTVTSEELTTGLGVTLDDKDTAAVYVIAPAIPHGVE